MNMIRTGNASPNLLRSEWSSSNNINNMSNQNLYQFFYAYQNNYYYTKNNVNNYNNNIYDVFQNYSSGCDTSDEEESESFYHNRSLHCKKGKNMNKNFKFFKYFKKLHGKNTEYVYYNQILKYFQQDYQQQLQKQTKLFCLASEVLQLIDLSYKKNQCFKKF